MFMNIIIGHASRDENKKYSGGKSGDQDKFEVCTRSYYMHSKGWYLLRPKSVIHANAIAEAMLRACNNNNIGYDQGNRLNIIKYGTNSTVKTEADCSSLVRQCVKEGTGIDAGNFTTVNEKNILFATGLFEKPIAVTSTTIIYNGDILVTKTKGHTVIVVSGNPRKSISSTTSTTNVSSTYTKTQFIKDVQSAIGTKVDGIVGNKTLNALVTVSKNKNNKHVSIKPLQKYLNMLGYECGTPDGIFGVKTNNAVISFQKKNNLITDGIVGKATWKKLLIL